MATPSRTTKPPNSSSSTSPPSSTPILSSIYIYNPTLGQTDSTAHEQLIFHYPPIEHPSLQDTDRQLRAIGLAQGIVQFARAFSPDEALVEVKTQKGFSVPVEVEKNWWMLATVEVTNPPPVDCITPSLLSKLLRNAYRTMRLHHKTFQSLLREHTLSDLISIITPHYTAFAGSLPLSFHSVDLDFDGIRWSIQHLEPPATATLRTWLRDLKARNPEILDVLLFRNKSDKRLHYEAGQEGLLFAGLQQRSLSWENIQDISLFIDSLPANEKEGTKKDDNEKKNGEAAIAKRSVSLPGLSESWDSVVQTSSTLFSALSFGAVPAKRSPLVSVTDPVKAAKNDTKQASTDDTNQHTGEQTVGNMGEWILGVEGQGQMIWLESTGEESSVPISLGNQRPGFLRDLSSSGQFSPGEDNLVQVEVHVFKHLDILLVFITSPSTIPPASSTFHDILTKLSPSIPTIRPLTPLSLKPFLLIHDPQTQLLYTNLPPVPPPIPPLPSTTFSLTPKRTPPPKRDPFPRDQALEIHSHILRLREQYPRRSHDASKQHIGFRQRGKRHGGYGERAREVTVKTQGWFIFRTLLAEEERRSSEFAEAWYILKAGSAGGNAGGGLPGQGSVGAAVGALGRGDDAGGLEDVARTGREKCREIYKLMSAGSRLSEESDDE